MGWVNLVLAGIDGALVIREGATLLRGIRSAERIVNLQGGEILSELTSEQIKRFDEAFRLRNAGQFDEAQNILAKLRQELGEDFEKAYSVFDTANTKFRTGAKLGESPTEESIKVGTVRMEEHPNYQKLIKEVKDKGYEIVEDETAFVSLVEVINKNREIIAVEKKLHVLPRMRYLDLEYEVGHIRQLERFGENEIFTDRLIERPNGQRVLVTKQADNVIAQWQNNVMEYHNRLDEFLRLYERGGEPELLFEHVDEANGGITYWYKQYIKSVGEKKSRSQWVEEYFPDLKQLRARYNQIINELRQTYPDIFGQERLR